MEREAAAKLLVAHRGKLLAYLWSILRNSASAEDIFQDVLIAAMEHAAEIDGEAHLLNWARQRARFRAIDYLRRDNRQPLLLSNKALDLLDPHWDALENPWQRQRIDALTLCLQKLSAYARRLVEMRYLEDRSGTEVAQALGREPHTVYTALSRAYRTLGECVERQLAGEDA